MTYSSPCRRIALLAAAVLLAACADHPTGPATEVVTGTPRSVSSCTNLRGTGEFALDPAASTFPFVLVYSGTVAGDLNGQLTVVEEYPDAVVPHGSSETHQAAHLFSRITLATVELGTIAGDEVAAATQVEPDQFRFNGRLVIDDGGSGMLLIHGELSTAGLPTGTIVYHGRVCG